MSENASSTAAAVVVDFPTPPKREGLTVGQCINAYMAAYTGRDGSRLGYLARWVAELGNQPVASLDADIVAAALDAYAAAPVQRFAGKDSAGAPRIRSFGARRPATVNRSKAVLSAVLTWAQRRRLTPKGWRNPCKEIPGLREDNARLRFLSEDERGRLLALARVSRCRRLHLLVLMALVTGARRGELLRLRYRDLDLDRGTASLAQTKNGERRTLVLTPAVVSEIKRQGCGAADALLFGSANQPTRAMSFETAWRKALEDARISDFRFHDLRHSCASYLAMSGASLIEIADVLGHKQLDVTRRYSHLTTGHKSALVNRVLGEIGQC